MDDSVEFGRLAVIVITALVFAVFDFILSTTWWTMLLWFLAAWPVISLDHTRSVARRAVGNCETALMQEYDKNKRLSDENTEVKAQRAQARLFAYLAKSPTLEADFPKHVSDLRSAVGEARNAEAFLRKSATGGEIHAAHVAALVDHVEAFLTAVDSTE